MGVMASQITTLTIVYSTVYSGADQRKQKVCIIGLCVGNSPVYGEFPAQMASNVGNVSIWWCHHDLPRNKLRVEWNCHKISIMIEKLLVKCAPGQITVVKVDT